MTKGNAAKVTKLGPVGDGVRWEEPPRPRAFGAPPIWRARVEPLRQRAGEWARLAEVEIPKRAYETAGYLRGIFPEFEFLGRKIDGRGVVFGRYMPKPTA